MHSSHSFTTNRRQTVIPIASISSIVLRSFSLFCGCFYCLVFLLAFGGLGAVLVHLEVGDAVVVGFHFPIISNPPRLLDQLGPLIQSLHKIDPLLQRAHLCFQSIGQLH